MVEVIVTHSAQQQRTSLLQYINEAFGARVALKVYSQLEHYHSLLVANPCLGAVEPLLIDYPEGYRSLVVHKHCKLVYYVDELGQKLYVTDFWDVRRAPATLVANK